MSQKINWKYQKEPTGNSGTEKNNNQNLKLNEWGQRQSGQDRGKKSVKLEKKLEKRTIDIMQVEQKKEKSLKLLNRASGIYDNNKLLKSMWL